MEKSVMYAGEQIKTFIPQREPILMVDKLFQVSDSDVETGLTIADNNIFVDGNMFCEPGIIEHIAQSSAVFAGYNDWINKRPISLGYIGEIKKFNLEFLPKIGDNLVSYLSVVSQALNITLMNATTKVDDKIVATCKIKIFMDKK
ncbi:MAG: hydroxymyristoyl-ACP dehydratase [Bacteroidales bacterium]|nr:hydroxymyristoyl-ACP dehydratase [Bacteroidales bacterium]